MMQKTTRWILISIVCFLGCLEETSEDTGHHERAQRHHEGRSDCNPYTGDCSPADPPPPDDGCGPEGCGTPTTDAGHAPDGGIDPYAPEPFRDGGSPADASSGDPHPDDCPPEDPEPPVDPPDPYSV
ncbi:MAG: hypothetical protein AAGF12_17115 [Myxococcota bacterium]